MANYYPLIARAVGSLNPNTPEQRRALYESCPECRRHADITGLCKTKLVQNAEAER